MKRRLLPWQYAGMSPMQRTLAWLRWHGCSVAIVERFIAEQQIKRDAFGCDVLACHEERGIVLVQVCGADVAAHVAKLERNRDARRFVRAGGSVVIIGWRELKAAGGWTPRIWSLATRSELALDEVLKGVAWQPRLFAA